ncbi:MAG: T9SS type A sorting domain-containing protein [Porphyromonadaceae bacterium]|nr:T9SS type A sorting domain-containing protein [Porphyromonadaceae bacterium]
MKKSPFSLFMVFAQRCLVLLMLLGFSLKMSAQEANTRTVTVNTNLKEFIDKGVLKKGEAPARIFVGEGEVTIDPETGSGKVIVPLKGNPKWNNRWDYIHVRVMMTKSGLYPASIIWHDVTKPEVKNPMRNDSNFQTKRLNGDCVITITYAEGKDPSQSDDDEDEEDEEETYTITYKVVSGQGTFEVVDADEEEGKFLLGKGEQLILELSPEDGYEIGFVKYDGKTLDAKKFNSYGRCVIGKIEKDMHFDVTFVKEGETPDPSSIEGIGQGSKELYPNPCRNDLFLKPASQLSIYSLTGVLVYETSEPTTHVDVSALPKGVYIAKVGQGQGMRVHRLVKK